VAAVGAPDVQGEFGLGYGTAVLLLFGLPQLASFVLEPPIFLLADRVPRKPIVVGGLALLGACFVVAGATASLPVFALALAVAGPAGGAGVSLAQATLVDARPDERERILARWALMGTLGDLATPLLLAGLALLAMGWREAFLIAGSLFLAYAAALLPCPFPTIGEPDGMEPPPLRDTIRAALRSRRLLSWLLGVALCGMLDETLVAFAALRLEALGADTAQRSLVLFCFMAGALAGLLAAERMLDASANPLRLLRRACALCAAFYLTWLLATGLMASALLLAGVGFFAAPLYPIAKAQAYRALPGQSGLVVASGQLFAPLELAVPLVLGLLADRFGLIVALTLLIAQPLGLLALARVPRD